MAKIKVYPVHENCFVLVHPQDGRISDEGSMWEDDGFTGRLLRDNEVTTDTARAHKFADDKKVDYTVPPPHATGSGVVKQVFRQSTPDIDPVTEAAAKPAATPINKS